MSDRDLSVRMEMEDRVSTRTQKLDSRLDKIGLTYERIAKTISGLEEQLFPILGPPAQETRKGDPGPVAEAIPSSLGMRLQELEHGAISLNRQLQELIDRIDL